jgi:6-phosphogluconate dehydrogenase
MQLGMIGLGRMGANMVRRLLKGRTQLRCVRQVAESGGASLVKEKPAGEAPLSRIRGEAREAAGHLADGPGGGGG